MTDIKLGFGGLFTISLFIQFLNYIHALKLPEWLVIISFWYIMFSLGILFIVLLIILGVIIIGSV
jgi:hypothetical protein